ARGPTSMSVSARYKIGKIAGRAVGAYRSMPNGGSGRVASVETEGARAERRYLQQASGNRKVLHEVNHLVLIGEVEVEADCGDHREDSEDRRRDPRLVADDEQQAAAEFGRHGDGTGKGRERQRTEERRVRQE